MEIIKEADYSRAIKEEIAPAIESVRTDGFLISFDETRIFYHIYKAENADRSVVIVHGFTESAEKYEELIWYFLNAGADVYIYDQRGHGRSGRKVANKTLTHVDRFSEYLSDLECFIDSVVSKELPLFIFAHSPAFFVRLAEQRNGVRVVLIHGAGEPLHGRIGILFHAAPEK